MNNTLLTAFGGIITALSILILFLANVFPTLSYTLPALAGVLLLIFVKEVDKKWPFMVYLSVSTLSLILISNKEATILYIFFFGYYVILKDIIEKRFSSFVKWILKFAVFNISIFLAFIILIYIFAIPDGDLQEYGKYVMLALGNVTFIVYDYTLSTLAVVYDKRWKNKLKKYFKKWLSVNNFFAKRCKITNEGVYPRSFLKDYKINLAFMYCLFYIKSIKYICVFKLKWLGGCYEQ